MSVNLVLRIPFRSSHLPACLPAREKPPLTSAFPKLARKLLLKLHVERIESPWPLKSGVVCPVAHNVTIAYLRPSNNSGLRIFVPRRWPCRTKPVAPKLPRKQSSRLTHSLIKLAAISLT